ncbi:uncharacterized protein LOC113302440 isoform X2 [Papaver somniferum]|uniref:uncharacterized protein LOC113302440 isoform X2 n=1 Tax=Papaver somniferum TaxID=3469 RepID=UPI000E6FE574|nr:uncharacterized protein LOC113302440 isoform X2 [Papaver somniferum]
MSAKKMSSDRDNRPQEETTDIKELLKVLIQSQAKLADAQAQQAKSQENIQNQMLEQTKSQEDVQNEILEVLRSIKSAGSSQDDDDDDDDDDDGDGDGNNDEETPEVGKDGVLEAKYYPDRNNILLEGDCKKTIEFLKKNPTALEQGVTPTSDTVLHVAIFGKREMILVEEIVSMMSQESLEYQSSDYGFTALHYAAQYGNLKAAKLMVRKNPGLLRILSKKGYTPLEIAVSFVTTGQKEVVKYLYFVTQDVYPTLFSGYDDGAGLLCDLIEANFYDMALCLVKQLPGVVMVKAPTQNMCGLEMMARRPFAFRSGTKLTWWQNLIYLLICIQPTEPNKCRGTECINRDEENPSPKSLDCIEASSSTTYRGILVPYFRRVLGLERLYNQKVMHQQAIALIEQMLVELRKRTQEVKLLKFMKDNPNIMKVAVKHGITEFVEACLGKFDYLIWHQLPKETLLKMAITERKEIIVNLICDTGDELEEKIDLVTRRDGRDNTILHYAAKLAPPAQLNLVSGAALQMQREMQWFKGVESILRESDRLRRNNKGDTAQMIFTKAHKGLMKEGAEWLQDTSGSCMIVAALVATVAFAAAFTVPGDVLALFSSITSVLMFLAIYTSRYAEMDFLKSLPQKLIFGLVTLFISVVAILVAFGASMFIVVGSRYGQALIPITLFSCCPLGLFAWLQLPLFVEMVCSTYWGSLFHKRRYVGHSSKKNKNDSKWRKKNKENEQQKEGKYTETS